MLELHNWRTVETFFEVANGVLESLDNLAAKANREFNLAEPDLAKALLFLTDTGNKLKRLKLAGEKPSDPGWAVSVIFKKI
jgi:hypothetical protein